MDAKGKTAKGRKREPWPHICPDCGTEFLCAAYSLARCPACAKKARRRSQRDWDKTPRGKAVKCAATRKYRAAHKEEAQASCRAYREAHRDELNAKQRDRYWADPEKQRLKSRLRQRMYKGDKKSEFELGRLTGKLQECPRLRVTAVNLPCGKRPECWWGKPCERCAGMTKARETSFGQWDF